MIQLIQWIILRLLIKWEFHKKDFFVGIYKNEWDHWFNLLSKNKDLVLNKAKDYDKNNKQKLKEQARDKYRSLSEEDKNKKREYAKNR